MAERDPRSQGFLWPRRKVIYVAILIFLILLNSWPFLAWANRIEPFICGLPFFVAYVMATYVLLTVTFFIGLKLQI